jgi:predicted flap endonuclease-1-like 5' DNA nuclease
LATLTDIEGVGEASAEKLRAAGIRSVDALLKKGATKKNREEIAKRSGFGHAVILKWVNYADLFRVKGVGGEFAELLEAAGVDTVPELAKRNPVNLHKKMAEVHEAGGSHAGIMHALAFAKSHPSATLSTRRLDFAAQRYCSSLSWTIA